MRSRRRKTQQRVVSLVPSSFVLSAVLMESATPTDVRLTQPPVSLVEKLLLPVREGAKVNLEILVTWENQKILNLGTGNRRRRSVHA